MVDSIQIADERWPVAQAASVCRWYSDRHPATLSYYDFAGRNEDPTAHDGVDLTDAGRLVIINAMLRPKNVSRMIEAGRHAPWDAVPSEADLLTDLDLEALLSGARVLYDHFRGAIGPTQRHKLLHLKRPRAFPIVDSVVRTTYEEAAHRAGTARGTKGPLYWPVLAAEMRDSRAAYEALITDLADDPAGRLTIPRLADILIWSLHGRQKSEARGAAAAALRASRSVGPTTQVAY